MFLLLYRLFCGYLYVRVSADNYEKILNLCAAKGIDIWRVSVKNDMLYFKIGIRSFKKLRIFKRNIPCRIHITKKVGVPFFIAVNKKRIGIPIGLIIFCLILNFMSGGVWNICVCGNETVSDKAIITTLKEIGIYEGARISNIDPEQKRYEFLLRQKDLSWAAINIEGSKVTVDVVETKKGQQLVDEPSNLKAEEDGIIKKIFIKSGVTQVKVGDTVQKGQLLVSGITEYDDGSVDFKRSVGNILAEVDYSFTIQQPLKVTEFLKTGKYTDLKVLDIFGINIPLYLGGVSGDYVKTKQNIKYSKGESYLPIRIITGRFHKLKKTTYVMTEEQALKKAEESAKLKITSLTNGGEIIRKESDFFIENGMLNMNVKIRCIKDIVFEEKLQVDTSN